MHISWQGLSCFEITAKTAAGEVKIVTDPYDNATGLRFPRTLEADLVTSGHAGEDAGNLSAVGGNPFSVKTPGEFEVKDVFCFAIPAPTTADGNHLLMRFEVEGMSVAHLGSIDRELSDDELEALEDIDILLLPVGGGRVAAPKVAAAILSQVEPRVVIPMSYGLPNLKEKLGGVDAFCKELGSCKREDATKYKVTRKDLPEEDMLVVVLSR